MCYNENHSQGQWPSTGMRIVKLASAPKPPVTLLDKSCLGRSPPLGPVLSLCLCDVG